ncbi:MAG: ATP-binding protein [Endomicrobiaceae bacterium]
MKQILILSGKGGTGKTTISAAFIELAKSRAFADCDVDAPNLHLITPEMKISETKDYYGLGKALIDTDKCIKCGICETNCHFGAIKNNCVNIYECEGCGLCVELCPVKAVNMKDYSSGDIILYKSCLNVFSTAKLKMGSGASGKLVSAVKKQLLNNMPDSAETVIIDGSPGIGCPVIASISGADLVIIVTEPTISGIHDMKRIIDTTLHFNIKPLVCINKFDINTDNTKKIEKYCEENGIVISGKIPFDETVVHAVNKCQSIAKYPESKAGKAVKEVWDFIYRNFMDNNPIK